MTGFESRIHEKGMRCLPSLERGQRGLSNLAYNFLRYLHLSLKLVLSA